MIDDNTIASNNNLASGNFSQNTLVSFNKFFNGLEKTVGLFIPSVRNALVERYRAETFYKIGMKTENIINTLGIEPQPIPPKAALPLFEQASLEHEETMFDLWAKLLANAVDNYNPIQLQFGEVLAKIGSNEAKILLDTYNEQKCFAGIGMAEICEKAKNNRKIDKHLSIEIHNSNNPEKPIFPEIEYEEPISLISLRYPYKIKGEIETFTKKFHNELDKYYKNKDIEFETCVTSDHFKKSENIVLSLNLLKQLNLIDFHFDIFLNKSENNTYFYNPQWGIVLTEFGYKLVDTLEKYNA